MDKRTKLELVVAGSFIGAVILIVLGCLIFPDLFWDRFVWKYYWGPIVADAGGDAGGITSSYNWFDTLTYGIILAFSAYFIHRLFQKMKLRVGTGFFLALSPIIVIGPAARVLEDMELFNEPIQYVFISPLIYIFLGILTLLTIVTAQHIERSSVRGNAASGLFLFLPGLFISVVIEAFPSSFNTSISIIPILLITSASVLVHAYLLKKRTWEFLVGLFWLQILLIILYIYLIWLTHGEWYDFYISMHNNIVPVTHTGGAGGVIVLLLLSTGIVALGIYLAARKNGKISKLLTAVNMLIIGGHMMDASATFVGIDFYGYTEKHVVPSTLMGWLDRSGFGYPAIVMYPLKLAFLLPALYFMDIKMEEDSLDNPHLIALVKLTILILGFAPGTRDIIRLSLGV